MDHLDSEIAAGRRRGQRAQLRCPVDKGIEPGLAQQPHAACHRRRAQRAQHLNVSSARLKTSLALRIVVAERPPKSPPSNRIKRPRFRHCTVRTCGINDHSLLACRPCAPRCKSSGAIAVPSRATPAILKEGHFLGFTNQGKHDSR